MKPPYVVKQGSRTAIVLLELSDRGAAIEMSEGPLVINSAFDLAQWQPFDYSVERAAASYLKHHAGLSPDARRALAAIIPASPAGDAQNPKHPPIAPNQGAQMSIEHTFTRIADALEALVNLQTGANLELERIAAAVSNDVPIITSDTVEAIDKVASKGRRRKAEVKEEPKAEVKEEPKAEVKEEPKAEPKEEPKAEVKEEPKAEVKEEPKAEVKEEPKAEVKVTADSKVQHEARIKAVQAVAAERLRYITSHGMTADAGRELVVGTIKSFGGDHISKVPVEKLDALEEALRKLDVTVSAEDL